MCVPTLTLQPSLTVVYLAHIFLIMAIISFFSKRYLKIRILNPVIPFVGSVIIYISSFFIEEYSYRNPIYIPLIIILTLSSLLGINIAKKERYIYITSLVILFIIFLYNMTLGITKNC